jgi:nucleoside-diphosphate-sugar epimerase
VSAPVLVTGGTGFVAGHLVAQLLDAGRHVRASVRPGTPADRRGQLLDLATTRPGRLELVAADLLDAPAVAAAVAGCEVVFHVASPFLLPEQITDPHRQLMVPAVQGTDNVLDAVDASPGVRRVVLTSTVGAVFGDYADTLDMPGRVLRETSWNTSSTLETNPYHLSKTRAETAAWDQVARQDRWDLVVLNPGLVLGPPLWPGSASGSLFLMDELFRGDLFFGAPDFAFTLVDVRDVARAHVAAAEVPTASGRYLLAHREMVSLLDIARTVRRRHPWRLRVPVHPVPDVLVRRLGARFGLTPDYVRHHLGIRFTVDTARSEAELGVRYRPVEETVLDHYEAWARQRRS